MTGMPFLCFRSEKELQVAGNTRTMAASPTTGSTAATSAPATSTASSSSSPGTPAACKEHKVGGAALESPRDVLDGPAWSDYQSEMLEDLQQPAAGMSASPYPAMLPLDPTDVDAYNCATLDCAAPYFDAEGCLRQQHQFPNLGLGLGGCMGLGGAAAAGVSMAMPPPPTSCSVDLRGIKVTNKDVIQYAMEVLGVNGLLQFVELWDRSRRRGQEEQQRQQQRQQQQQQAATASSWDLHNMTPPWPLGHPMPDGMQLLPPLLPFGSLEEPAVSFGDSHSPNLPPAPSEDDKSYVLLNFPATKCIRLSSPPAAPPTPGDHSSSDHRRAAKFVTATSFASSRPSPSPAPVAALPAPVPLELLGPCLVPPLQQQVQQPDVPSFVPVAQTGPGIVNSAFQVNLLNSTRRTRLQQQRQMVHQAPVKSSPAATTRAARKHRMARQRHSHAFLHHHHHHHLRGSTNSPATAVSPALSGTGSPAAAASNVSEPRAASQGSNASSVTQVRQAVPTPPRAQVRTVPSKHGRSMDGLQFLFQKELKPSDVGSLGRIILPKREAESQLPPLNMKDGMPIHAEDFDTGKTWTLKYRYWPNNKSRMYVLECTGEFVKMNRLEEGDWMILYRCTSGRSKYVLRGKKQSQGGSDVVSSSEESTKLQQHENGTGSREGDSGCTSRSASPLNVASPVKKCVAGGTREACVSGKVNKSVAFPDPTIIRCGPEEDEFLQELTEDSSFEWGGLATLERFPSLEAGDMSIDEILGLGEHSTKSN